MEAILRQPVRQYIETQRKILNSDGDTGNLEEMLEELYYELSDEEVAFVESKLEENEYFDTE